MTLNNKGFAITGILYTLFILFLLLLVSVLAALSSRKRLSEAGARMLEDSYTGTVFNTQGIGNFAPVLGRYKYKFSNATSSEVFYCYTYLKKGASLDNVNEIVFTNNDCNDYKKSYSYELVEVISFENGEE